MGGGIFEDEGACLRDASEGFQVSAENRGLYARGRVNINWNVQVVR